MLAFQFNMPRWDREAFVSLSRGFRIIWNGLAPRRLFDLWHRAQHPAQPHRFTSDAFIADGVVQPIPAPYFPQPFRNWRLVSVFHFGITCLWYNWLLFVIVYNLGAILELELIFRIISFVLRKAAIINEPFSLITICKRFLHFIVGVTSCSRSSFLYPCLTARPQGHSCLTDHIQTGSRFSKILTLVSVLVDLLPNICPKKQILSKLY